MEKTYGLLDLIELIELLAKGIVVGVPSKATAGVPSEATTTTAMQGHYSQKSVMWQIP